MIGGFNIIPNNFKDCKGWQVKLLWMVIMIIGFFVVIIPNWFDKKFRK